ncbi:MAG TPA: hypothetical protein VHA53_08820, partial [Nitrolancea sp.]|nr:hypothetical protein [Nitrolancea sp.]
RDPEQRAAAEAALARALDVPIHLTGDALWARIPATDNAPNAAQIAAGALAELSFNGIPVAEFALGQPSLDEVFLTLTSQDASIDRSTQEQRV